MIRGLGLLLAIGAAGPVAAQGRWDATDRDGWLGAGICPYGEIAAGGYFCLEMGCDEAGPLEFRMRLTEREAQDRIEGIWTVDRREAGKIVLQAVDGAAATFSSLYDPVRDATLIEKFGQGSAGSFTILNRRVRANRPFSLDNVVPSLGAVFDVCPLADGSTLAPANWPAQPPPPPPAPPPPAPEPPLPGDDVAAVPPPVGDVPAPPAAPIPDPASDVLAEIEAECVARGGAFVEVQPDFLRRVDFDGDGIEDLEVSYSGAVCDAAANLYCDAESCLTRLFLGLADGGYRQVYEGSYRRAEVRRMLTITFDAGSAECPGTEAPCDRHFHWVDGALVPLDQP
ncbi:hypothetical protein [Roseisalinus antarcticus]|uniref:Uncharacterized protein n=1 Tax=Roseisalinus antarcticus TaxID=254357 RepID=A0A1Y5TU35_9RHOB|nr:hypothetical protein [Roseisalinus antarcticus]SLN70199.1 hypothetical protein ROA7023_03438 [Roseisalinus antarcticus]